MSTTQQKKKILCNQSQLRVPGNSLAETLVHKRDSHTLFKPLPSHKNAYSNSNQRTFCALFLKY